MAKDKVKDKKKKSKEEKKNVQALNIQISDEPSKFSFKVGGKELEGVLGKVSAVLGAAGSNEKNFVLLAVKGSVVLIGHNADSYVYMLIKSGVASGDGSFGFEAPTIQGIIKGRVEMEFTFNGGDCTFKDTKGRYTGTFHTKPISSDKISVVNLKFRAQKEKEEKDSKEAKRLKLFSPAATVLPRTVLDCLKEGVALTSIKDIFSGKALLSYMQLDEKGILTVSAYDAHHFGYYRCKVDAGGMTFKAALPSSHFMIIDRMVEGTEAKFHVMNENIRVEGEGFAMILPATQVDPRNYEMIPNFLKVLPKEPPFRAKFSLQKFQQMTDNLFTLHSVNTAFEFVHKKGSDDLDVTFKTTNGSASDSIKTKIMNGEAVKVKINPQLLRDTLGLLKTQVETSIAVVPDKVLRIDAKTKLEGVVSLMTAVM